MSLLGFLGKAALGGLNIATGGVAGSVVGAVGSIIHPSAKSAGGISGILPVSRGPGSATAPWNTGALVRPDSVRVQGRNVMGLYQSGSATAYYSNPKGGKCLTKSGKPRRVKKNGKCWKRPSMNAANPRALKRAIRRIDGFKHLARAVGFHPPKALHHISKGPITSHRKRAAKCR